MKTRINKDFVSYMRVRRRVCNQARTKQVQARIYGVFNLITKV